VPHDGNSQQSFTVLPLKPNGQIKNMGGYDRIPSDPVIFRQESPNGVLWRSISEHDILAISMMMGIR
jgi:hypothetical protein